MADFDVQSWFTRNGLPFSDAVSISLDNWGVECVEQLKMLEKKDFLDMFEDEKFIIKKTAEIVVEALHETPLDLSKCGTSAPISESATSRFRKSNLAAAAAKLDGKRGRPSKKSKAISNKTPQPRKMSNCEGYQLIENIVKAWSTTGQQNNLLRLHVCNALREGHTKAKIARIVRQECYGDEHPWNGIGSKDPVFKQITASLLRIHRDMKTGKLDYLNERSGTDQLTALMSKSVQLGSRGRVKGSKTTKKKAQKEEDAGDQNMEQHEEEGVDGSDESIKQEVADAGEDHIDSI